MILLHQIGIHLTEAGHVDHQSGVNTFPTAGLRSVSVDFDTVNWLSKCYTPHSNDKMGL